MNSPLPRIILYTRPGCGLCEEAEEVLESVRARLDFVLIKRNILDDLSDYSQYRYDIPVIVLDGQEFARHHVSEAELVAAVNAMASGGRQREGPGYGQ